MRIFGVVCIVVGLVLFIGLRFIGPPGTRGRAAWPAYLRLKVAVAGGTGVIFGLYLLLGGGD